MKDYFIGLDLGSISVGWAVVDENNKLIKKRGQNLWGVRLFDEPQTAEGRRLFRRQRRTINKRSWRQHLLREELKEFVLKEDNDFFKRLKNSQAKPQKYFLFEGKFNDTTYARRFPTIFHLREELKNEKAVDKLKKEGIYYRLLFLAINDILKNRGNFLASGRLSIGGSSGLKNIENQIISLIELLNDDEDIYDESLILKSLFNHVNDIEKINRRKSDHSTTFLKAILGGDFNLQSLLKDYEEKHILNFEKEEWEENLTGDEAINGILYQLFEIYSAIRLFILIGDAKSLSEAKIRIYNTHKKQLSMLKKDLKTIDSLSNTNHFESIFLNDNPKGKTYSNYVGKLLDGKQKLRVQKKTSREDLIKELEKIKDAFKKAHPDIKVLEDIHDEGYLEIPTNPDNRFIPYQLHEDELLRILSAFKNTTEHERKDEISERIHQLLTFKAPYYVGPLSNRNAGADSNYWLVKNKGYEDVNITPYNFNEVVDKWKTNKAFIKRMLRTCTYLNKEFCIQQETILYQDYIFYNTINKLQINDAFVTEEQKVLIYNMLLKGTNITKKRLTNLLGVEADAQFTLFGKDATEDKQLSLSLSAKRRFVSIFKEQSTNPFYQVFFDHVVNEITFIDQNEVDLRKQRIVEISKDYQTVTFNDEQLDKLSKLNSKKWGNLSFKLLSEMLFDDGTGELRTLISILKDTNLNLIEIMYIGDNKNRIDNENDMVHDLSTSESLHEYLKSKYIAPQARRTILEATKIIDEIIQIMDNHKPKKIAIEFTREIDTVKKEKDSRYNQLKKIYDELEKDYQSVKANFDSLSKNQDKLKSRKIFLYFKQLGQDLYTGKPIDFNILLSRNDIYDIDHIYPQSRIKDDSFDNLVLTSKIINGKLGNVTPLPEDIRKDNAKLWLCLKGKRLISSKKYERLTRDTPLSDEELLQFVNRQKTTLDWMNKELADILKIKYADANNHDFIVYSKSRIISEFRNQKSVDLIKFRELNDFHHAHDAYLNIVCGRLVQEKVHVILKAKEKEYKSYNIQSILKFFLNKQINYMKSIFKHHDILVTKKPKINDQGAFWNQQIESPKRGKADTLVPLKKGMDVSKYGGYTGRQNAFFTIIKKKEKIRIEPIDTIDCQYFYANGIMNDKKYEEFIKDRFQGSEIIMPILPIGQKVLLNGIPYYIASKDTPSIVYHSAGQVVLSSKAQRHLRKINRLLEKFGSKVSESFWSNNGIEKNDNEEVFQEIVKKMELLSNDKKIPIKLYEAINQQGHSVVIFKNLNLEQQIKTLMTIISVLRKPVSSSDKIFGTAPRNRVSQNVSYNFSVIRESITGFYKKEIVINVSNNKNKKGI